MSRGLGSRGLLARGVQWRRPQRPAAGGRLRRRLQGDGRPEHQPGPFRFRPVGKRRHASVDHQWLALFVGLQGLGLLSQGGRLHRGVQGEKPQRHIRRKPDADVPCQQDQDERIWWIRRGQRLQPLAERGRLGPQAKHVLLRPGMEPDSRPVVQHGRLRL